MLTECLRMLLRRWILCALAVVLAIAAGIGVFAVVKPVQESRAQVLLVGSVTQPGVNGPTNPLINLGGSLAVVASVVQVVVSDAKVAQELYSQQATAKYTVTPNLAENAGPTLLIATDDKSGEMAQKTMRAVIDQVNQQLVKLQQDRNVQPNLFITTITLTQSEHPLPVRKGQVQKAIMATIGVLVLLVLLILLLERRKMSKTARQVQALQRPRRTKAKAANSPASSADPVSPANPVSPATPVGPATPATVGGPADPAEVVAPVRANHSEKQGDRPSRRTRRREGREQRETRDAAEDSSDESILPGGLTTGSPRDPARR